LPSLESILYFKAVHMEVKLAKTSNDKICFLG